MEATPGTSEGEYANNRVFYEQARAALGAMRFRAQASPGGEPTVQHLAELEKQIENLRRLHERRGQAGLTRAAIDPIRTAINAELKAIVALELARKRGR
ncbi:MAG: hypothetical protein HYV08_10085 [Deltaproteobacteria bacterium]|nr:hypothetical protein [Deltaproteobacteria bacterium]